MALVRIRIAKNSGPLARDLAQLSGRILHVRLKCLIYAGIVAEAAGLSTTKPQNDRDQDPGENGCVMVRIQTGEGLGELDSLLHGLSPRKRCRRLEELSELGLATLQQNATPTATTNEVQQRAAKRSPRTRKKVASHAPSGPSQERRAQKPTAPAAPDERERTTDQALGELVSMIGL